MTLGFTKLHPARAGWMMVSSGPAATSAGGRLFGRDLVKGPTVPEVCRLRFGPSPEFRIVDGHQIVLGEVCQERLVGDAARIARTIVVLCRDGLALGRI